MKLRDALGLNLYRVLGVDPNASTEEIRRAYRRLAAASHPDLKPHEWEAAERRMKELNLAASVLCDQARRAAYDRARTRPRRSPFWSWPSSTGFGVAEDWVTVPKQGLDPKLHVELGKIVRGFQSWPARKLSSLACLTATSSPASHALVTVASVGLALFLISAARPSSLKFLFQSGQAEVAVHIASSSS